MSYVTSTIKHGHKQSIVLHCHLHTIVFVCRFRRLHAEDRAFAEPGESSGGVHESQVAQSWNQNS